MSNCSTDEELQPASGKRGQLHGVYVCHGMCQWMWVVDRIEKIHQGLPFRRVNDLGYNTTNTDQLHDLGTAAAFFSSSFYLPPSTALHSTDPDGTFKMQVPPVHLL